jgi:predicted MFS family arabinose efflux permease
MSGLLTGILLSRTLAGFVSSAAGWRTMFWLGVPIALAGALLMRLRLPEHHPSRRVSYAELMSSLIGLWRREPLLRRAALTQALIFASFSAFWTVLALRLEQPPLNLGAASAGLFGVVGAVGVAMAPLAGRVADRRGPSLVIAAGALATVLAWVVFAVWPSVAGLVVGVILLDFGVQIALVSHQHQVYGLHPEFKSRLNTLFMTTMFLGGAAGSFAAAETWRRAGWIGVCILGGGLVAIALISRLFPSRSVHSSPL